ncbi:MAG: tRNA-dihydrouridine synthase family protein [Bacteroidales bacterium]|nr:tRNA-dihydrouridine synthase family protein [Bacteroidales bacterium]
MSAHSNDLHLQLGPFQGITDVYYRNTFQKYFGGIDTFFTPFFSGIHKENSKSLRTDEIDVAHNNPLTLTPQLLSNDGIEILRFADQCQAMGYREVNLNMGCPYPQVARKKRGSGMMPYTDLVAQIADEIRGKMPLAFSIKCRLGYYDSTEIDALIPIFNSLNLSELIVHARLGKQMYGGIPDFEKFAAIIPQINTRLVYNGDVFSPAQLQIYQQKFSPINHWMLGRGILSDPFLASDLKGTTLESDPEAKKEQVLKFITSLYLLRRKAKNNNPAILGRMKELWSYLYLSFDEAENVWRSIRKSTDFDSYEDAVARVFKHHHWLGTGYVRAPKDDFLAPTDVEHA